MSRPSSRAYDTRLAKALSHPVRIKALEMMSRGVASPSDVARALGLPVANVSYHVNTLLRLKCIEEVEQRHVRGAIEHRYRAVTRAHVGLHDMPDLPVVARHELSSTIARNAFEDVRGALEAETYSERDSVHMSWTRVTLDEQGWTAVAARVDELLDAVLAEQAASLERMTASGEEGIQATVSLFHHESSKTG